MLAKSVNSSPGSDNGLVVLSIQALGKHLEGRAKLDHLPMHKYTLIVRTALATVDVRLNLAKVGVL
eukprot:6459092-Amphidinium_carterae.1